MKKMIFVLMSALAISSAAFASTGDLEAARGHSGSYHCDLLKSDAGNGIYGGPGYAVILSNGAETVELQVSSLLSHTGPVTYEMNLVKELGSIRTYEAEGVTATIVERRVLGYPAYTVSISKTIGNESYSASCN